MHQPPIPSNIERILKFTMLMILMSTFMILVLGHSLVGMNREIKELSYFLSISKDVKPNFEKSLSLYSTNTKQVIDYVLALRPGEESEYIEFISGIEAIGQDLSLNLVLQSLEDKPGMTMANEENTLDYSVSFYGDWEDLSHFLTQLEQLPYFVKVAEIDYLDPQYIDINSDEIAPNITVTLYLYVK